MYYFKLLMKAKYQIVCIIMESDDGELFYLGGLFVVDLVNVYLVFLLELLHRTKMQQAHVDQPLEVLMKCKDIFPDEKNPSKKNLELNVQLQKF